MKKICALLLIMTIQSCKSIPSENEARHQFAWFHGNCLALKIQEVNANSKVYLLNEKEGLIQAIVVEKAKDDKCLPLLDDRKEANISAGYTFYRIEGKENTISQSDIGVAIIGIRELSSEVIDINDNSQPDHVGTCTTSEGIKFYAWDTGSKEQTPFWEAYYYLGYDIEPSCYMKE